MILETESRHFAKKNDEFEELLARVMSLYKQWGGGARKFFNCYKEKCGMHPTMQNACQSVQRVYDCFRFDKFAVFRGLKSTDRIPTASA
jgi:hypothetical protein